MPRRLSAAPKRYRVLSSVAACAALSAMTLSACSSSKHSTGTGGGTGSTPTGVPYKIGAIVGLSGVDSSSFSVAGNALKAWEQWTNSNGGINGHPVSVIIKDSQGSPTVALSAAQSLVEGDHVIAVTDFAGGLESSFGPYLEKQAVPLIGPSWTELWGTTVGHKYVYETDASLPAEFILQFLVAKDLGGTKAGAVAQGTVFDKLWKYGANYEGLSWYKTEQATETTPSYAAQCLDLKQAGVDVIVSSFGDLAFKRVVDECAAQGYHPIVVGQSSTTNPDWLTDSNFIKAGGSIEAFPWFETSSAPGIVAFNQAMQKYDPQALTTVPIIATQVWNAMTVFETGAKAGNLGDTPSAQGVITGLNTISNETFGGLLPPTTYANGGNLKLPTCSYVIEKSGQNWKVANNGQPACLPYADMLKGFAALI